MSTRSGDNRGELDTSPIGLADVSVRGSLDSLPGWKGVEELAAGPLQVW